MKNRMNELVVISGKGGTGKTSITSSLSYLAGETAVIVDCDVDAADMHLLLNPDFNNPTDFYSGLLAKIDQEKCIKCGKCKNICRFDAIPFKNNRYTIEPIDCEGCGYCEKICPTDAIQMTDALSGKYFISKTRFNNTLVHARLAIAADNSGKLVTKIKNEAKNIAKEENSKYIIVDGSPGIGCPVVSSLSGANFVLLVTEPTLSGLHDLKRIYELVKSFHIKAGCIINKYDLNLDITSKIESFLQQENIIHLANLPYSESFTKAIVNGKTIVEYDNGELKEKIIKIWTEIKNILK